MINDLYIYDEHELIMSTIGYDNIAKIDTIDIPEVLKFLRIVDNYMNMCKVYDNDIKIK